MLPYSGDVWLPKYQILERTLSCKRVTTDAEMKEFVTLDCIYRNKVGISEGGIGVNELSILDLMLYCHITVLISFYYCFSIHLGKPK